MTFINGMVFDDGREPLMVRADGVVNADVQRDFDLIWDNCSDLCEIL